MTVTISSLASASVMAENTALTARSAAALDSDACVATWVASSDFVIDRFLEIAVGYGVPADDAVSFALHWEFVILSFVIVFATRKLAPTKGTASVTAMSIQDQINMAAPGGHSQCNFLAVPIHVGALPWAAKAVYDYFGESIHPGDVFLLNDPYRGGNHLPDLTAFVPVFDGDRFAFWSINRSHQSDIGGATHGAYNPLATEIWQEGVRIPPLRLYERGRLREDVYEMIVLNVRHPRDFRGDVAAMIGSARVGERRLDALIAELGSETTHAAVEAVLVGARGS